MWFPVRGSVTDHGHRDPFVKNERISIIPVDAGKPLQFIAGSAETMNLRETVTLLQIDNVRVHTRPPARSRLLNGSLIFPTPAVWPICFCVLYSAYHPFFARRFARAQ